MKHPVIEQAKALARRNPTAPTARSLADGVIPLTDRAAVEWARSHRVAWPPDSDILFKLGVARGGQVLAVVLAAKPLTYDDRRFPDEQIPGAGNFPPGDRGQFPKTDHDHGVPPVGRADVELTVLAPRGELAQEAFERAIAAAARAALALGYERVVYYLPHDDRGHPYDMTPLQARSMPSRARGELPWRKFASGWWAPWARYAKPSSGEQRHAWRQQEQIEAILDWEDVVAKRESELGIELDERGMSDLALREGFDYYDGWRPYELGTAEEVDDLDEGFFDRFVLDVQPPRRALFVLQLPAGSLDMVNAVLKAWHGHLPDPIQGYIFAVGVFAREVPGRFPEHLRAIAVVSWPRARGLGTAGSSRAAEVIRVAVGKGLPELQGLGGNAASEASMALGACVEALKHLGFDRIVSSILLGERGRGYIAAGWRPVAVTTGGEWAREGRARGAAAQPGYKVRFETGPGAATAADPKALAGLIEAAYEAVQAGQMRLGGLAPEAGTSKPNDAMTQLWRAERAAFERRFPGSSARGSSLVVVDRECVSGRSCERRALAEASWPRGLGQPGVVTLVRRALDLPPEHLRGLLRHELGHLADANPWAPGAEQRADDLAQQATGQPIRYADVDGAHDVQTIGPGAYPRPGHLHR